MYFDYKSKPLPTCEYCGEEPAVVSNSKLMQVRRFNKKWIGYNCHVKQYSSKRGANSKLEVEAMNAGFDFKCHPAGIKAWSLEKVRRAARAAGYTDCPDFINKDHRYLRHRKDYCENHDGHLGFSCDTNGKARKSALDVHHRVYQQVGGTDHPDNLITLCVCCHRHMHSLEYEVDIEPFMSKMVIKPTMQIKDFDTKTYQYKRSKTDAVYNPGYEWVAPLELAA